MTSYVERRKFLATLGGAAAAWPRAARAQQARKIPRIGVLWPNPPATFEFMRQGLQDFGYVEGRNIGFEFRWAEGKLDRLPELAAELVRLQVDVIVTLAPQATLAAKSATPTIPIVFVAMGDPLASGVVDSLAHPGANLTGTTRMISEMSAKHVELLKQAVPPRASLAVLWNPTNSSHRPALLAAEAAARSLSLQVHPLEVRAPGELDGVFAAIAERRSGGVLFIADPVFFIHLKRMVDLVASRRLPAICNFIEFPKLGGFMGYAPSIPDEFRHAASLVDKDPQGRQARRSAGRAADEVSTGHQLEDRQGARPHRTDDAARPRRRGDRMRRREFITLVGGAAAMWPLAARAQQPAMPVIGFLDSRSADAIAERLRSYRLGLKETGYIEGENVAIIHRFAENKVERLRELAADLVRRQVAVIGTAGDDVALVAKAATTTIPIVFIASQDPVKLGLVTSLARPTGNMTGINFFTGELVAKRLEILHELVPKAARVAVLVNPANHAQAETTLRELTGAARGMGLDIQVLNASTSREIDAAFATLTRAPPDALFVASDTFFTSRLIQVVNLATRHGIPTSFPNREFTEHGALMSYGASIADAWRQSGLYTGRILKGTEPADLPVMQSTKLELVINNQTARMLGITVPQTLLASADEVIE